MAFTKVSPAGIGSTPGDGYRIGDSFLHSTGVEITNINATGILTAASLDISGSIDFDGHTELDNLNVAGVSTFNDDVNVVQGKKINFGNTNGTTGHVYYDGSTTRFQTNVGLNIGSPVVALKSANLGEAMLEAVHNGAVKLWYDSSTYSTAKLETTATGVTIDGTAVAGALDISGDIDVDGHTNLDNVSIAGVTTFASSGVPAVKIVQSALNTNAQMDIDATNGGQARLNLRTSKSGTNRAARIDFFNQHSSTTPIWTLISDYDQNATNDFRLVHYNEKAIVAQPDGVVQLYYDGTIKFNTASTGATVHGSADPNLTIRQGGSSSSGSGFLAYENVDGNGNPRSIAKIQGKTVGNGGYGDLIFQTAFNNVLTERLRITSINNSTGKIGINTASPRAVLDIEGHAENATLFLHSNDANANLAFSDNTGGARILNYGGDLAFRTGANAHAFGTNDSEKLRIEDNGSVGIGTDDASWGLSGNGGLVVGSGTGAQAITIFCAGNADLSFGNAKSGTARYKGLIRYSHGDDSMRFRTATSERLLINSSGNVQIGSANNPGNALRYLDVYNTNTGSSAGSILRLLTTKSDGSSAVGLDIVKYKTGGAYIINNENVGADTGFIAFNTGSSGISPATHLRVAGNGEVVVSPRNGGASNNRTSIHFNNAAHTPFIAFKSNNVTEAVYIKAMESSGGCDLGFQTKNTSGTLLSRLTLKNTGDIVTHQLAGNEKGYPLVMGTGTVSSNTNMSGSLNMHDINGVNTGGGNNYHIGGWVFLGNDQAAAPYPVRRFKIFAPGAFSNGTIVYQVWHDGDANYYYGGLYEIRLNLWTDGDIEGVSLRCVNGYRDDLRVFAYNDDNGIMIQPSSIWGRIFIRRFGWDDNGRNPGSSHCAVANNGALAIYNSSGTDDGTIPTSGSPVELYSFDGTSGSASSTHTGGYNIESASYFDG